MADTIAFGGRLRISPGTLIINLTADDWKLYDIPHRNETAAGINAAMRHAIHACANAKEAWYRTEPLIDALAGTGARDTEAREVMGMIFGMAFRSNEDAALIRELVEALRPLAEKHVFPEDAFDDGSWKDDEDLVAAQSDNETADDVWIKRGWVRRARAAIEKAEAAIGQETNKPA